MKKKITGGALFRKMQMQKRFKNLAIFGLFLIAFLITGSVTGDFTTGIMMAGLVPMGLGKGDPDPDPEPDPSKEVKQIIEKFNKAQNDLKALIESGKTNNENEIKALKDQLKDLTEKRMEKLNEIIEKQGVALTALKDQMKNVEKASKEKQMTLRQEVKENMANLKALSKKANAKVAIGDSFKEVDEIVLTKALVLRTAVDSTEQAQDLPDVGQLAYRALTAYDLFPKVQVGENNNGTIRYYDWDEDTIVRAAASVAEGAAFPESTAKWKKYTISIEKIGDSLPVTEEFFEDEMMFAAELQLFLITNVYIVRDTQLVVGTGTGNQLKGVYTSAPTYAPSASGIADANIYDLAVKMKEAITENGGSKYRPNFAMMHISDINKLKLKKDNNDNYIIYPNASRDGQQVDGLTVIENNAMTANTMVIGDSRFGKIYEKVGVSVAKGYVGTQFTEDEMTLKVRTRLALLIREVDKTGFLKCDNITAALATLATP